MNIDDFRRYVEASNDIFEVHQGDEVEQEIINKIIDERFGILEGRKEETSNILINNVRVLSVYLMYQ